MATVLDEWHIAAAKVSPLIWEIQKAQNWCVERAFERLKTLKTLARSKDYIGILTSEPELESERDRLVIVPINYPLAKYKHPFLVERERVVIVYDWDGKTAFEGEMTPRQETDFLKWCSGFFIRIKGVKPPTKGP